MSRRPLALFTEVPHDYEDWLDGFVPNHPHFDKDALIQAIVLTVKDLLFQKILNGCEELLRIFRPKDADLLDKLTRSLDQNQALWKAVISGHKYGVIYLCSRTDACNLYFNLIQENPVEARLINEFLSQKSSAIRAINYGVRHYIHDERLEKTLTARFVPPYAIAVTGPGRVIVREFDFRTISGQKALEMPTALYDLHDFSHMVTATLNEILYGNKYQSSLSLLKKDHTKLITSPGMRNLTGPLLSDGILFSEFLAGIFTQQVSLLLTDGKDRTYEDLTKVMATKLAEYLIGERKLVHPSTGTLVKNPHPPTPYQLAILAQNKSYELPASEMEQKVFTRGGPVGDSKDELDALNPLQRIEALASTSNKRWMYFEVRNTLKHRAQAEAYCLVARELLRRGEEVEICEMILESLKYEDVKKAKKRRNLWKIVAGREWDKMSSREKWEIVGGDEGHRNGHV